jgi:very-short-patch-repair endonuclease
VWHSNTRSPENGQTAVREVSLSEGRRILGAMPATSPSSSPWLAADALLRAQHGLITHAQLRACGLTATMVRTARESGRLAAVHPGVFRSVGAPVSHLQLLLGATLRAGPSAVASHRAAAHLWDLRRDESTVEISVPESSRSKPRNVTVHRTVDHDSNHFTTRRGIPVTKPARTIVDLAAVLGRPELCEIVDRALVTGLVSDVGLRRAITELGRRGRVGPSIVRDVLDQHPLGGVRPESVLEPVMAAIVRHTDVADEIVYQYKVCVGGRAFRIDFAAPRVKLAIEVLGLREHGTRQAVIDDSERRRLLTVDGWQVVEYTKTAMTRSPVRVAREIAQLIDDRDRVFAALGVPR